MPGRLKEALSADPLQRPWGFYLNCPQGPSGLCWFANASELCAFLGQGLWPALSTDPPPAGLAGLLEGSAALRWELLDKVNEALEPVAQLHWWGSLEQLYAGEDPFAKDLREAWRDRAGRGPQDFSALQPEEQHAFAGFLKRALNEDGSERGSH